MSLQDLQTELFNEVGAFFAFSNEQFNQNKVEGVKYVQISSLGGIICPKENVNFLIDRLSTLHKESRENELKTNSKESIIKKSLYNYESFYTGELDETIEEMKAYGITKEEVIKVYREELINTDN